MTTNTTPPNMAPERFDAIIAESRRRVADYLAILDVDALAPGEVLKLLRCSRDIFTTRCADERA